MTLPIKSFVSATSALCLLTLAGCGEEELVAAVESTGSIDRVADAGQSRAQRGDCDLLDMAELVAAFDGRLTFGQPSGSGARGSGCTVPVIGFDHGELILQVQTRAGFETRKEAYASMTDMTPVSIGVEGYTANRLQVIAVNERDIAISLGLQIIHFGELPFTEDQIAPGVETTARRVMGQL